MVFNSDSYYANKYRRSAWENLARARWVKGRIATGESYDFELGMVERYAAMARMDLRLSRLYRQMAADRRAARRR